MFTFITSNKNKWKEVCEILNFKIPYKSIEVLEIQDLELKKILVEKAKYAFLKIKKAVVVEDVSLCLEGFKNFPGPLVKWVIKAVGAKGIIDLCKISKNFNAKASCGICAYDGKKFYYFEGNVFGNISKKIRGKNGFGWDPVFIPRGFNNTYAEMSQSEKNKISHRKKAWSKFEKFIKHKKVK